MRGYPKVIATKADFLYLLAMPEYKDQALADLKAIYELQDDTMEVVKSSDTDDQGKMVNVITETVPAPMPKWRRMGFESRQDVLDLYGAGDHVGTEQAITALKAEGKLMKDGKLNVVLSPLRTLE